MLLVPHREGGKAETVLPSEYQMILAVVRQAGAPVATRAVGEALGLVTGVWGKLEPLRGNRPSSPSGAGCASCPTAASPCACDQHCRPTDATWGGSWRNCGAPDAR